jgi:hypothetical protein
LIYGIRRTEKKNRAQLFSTGQFGLGLAFGVICTVLAGLLLETTGISLTREELIGFAPAFAAVAVAGASAVLSLIALHEQRLVRQAGTDPVLIAHLDQREDEPFVVNFAISNVGAGAAMNEKTSCEKPSVPQDRMMVNIFDLEYPISVILQNRSVVYPFGTGPMLLGDEPIPPFRVDLSYQDIEGSAYAASFTIDVKEMEARPANKPPITSIKKSLEEISKAVRGATRQGQPLHVRHQSVKEYRAEMQEWQKQRDEK